MRVLLISKPLSPPWRDSGKNWARDVARYASRPGGVEHCVLIPAGCDAWDGVPGVVADPVYAGDSKFAPRLLDNARALRRLMRRTGCDAVHFCFAPNPRSNALARLAMRWRRQPSVHTVLSVPERFEEAPSFIFADKVVCVSRSTADKLIEVGVGGVEVIRASIPVPKPLREVDPGRIVAVSKVLGLDSGRPVVVFPGDYEYSRGAEVFSAAIERLWQGSEADFVFACRLKSSVAVRSERLLRERLAAPIEAGRVHFVREVDDMRALLALARVVALPSESTYAKMDLPLVLLEALAEETPIVLADVAPLRETLGQNPTQSGGALVPPLNPEALARALAPLIRDEKAAAELGRAGRQHVLAHHDAAKECQKYAAIYAGLK